MVNLNIEKALLSISFDLLTDLSSQKKIKKSFNPSGYLYTYYNKLDNSIKIGFSYSLIKEQNSKHGYYLINARKGFHNELKYLKETLEDLGYSPLVDNVYYYSDKLKLDLEKLGWNKERDCYYE